LFLLLLLRLYLPADGCTLLLLAGGCFY